MSTLDAPSDGATASAGARLAQGWAAVREALRGSRQDYTEGSLDRAIVLLAVPMVLEMAMESLFAIADVFWVSQLGADAVATVGLTESMLTMLYAVAVGLSIGATATVARRIGEHDPDRAALAAVQTIVLGVLFSAAIGAAGALNAKRLLGLMGATPSVIEQGWRFTAIMFGGNATILLLFLINAVFRGAGDAAIAMRVLWFANGINILLGPCFIFGLGPFPALGVTGAAVATNIGRGSGVVYQLYRLTRGPGRVVVRARHVRLDTATMRSVLRLSMTGIVQTLINTTSWVGLIRILSGFGSAALAGYTIGIRIIIFALLPSVGLSNAAATLVGQNLGAGKPDRAERAAWRAAYFNMWFLGAVGLTFVLFPGPIVRAFTGDPAVIPYGVACLRTISFGFVFYAYGMVLTAAFNGAGDTTTPTLINLFCFWLWEIPIAWLLARRLGWGPTGVFAAVMIAFSTLAVVSGVLFKRGRWKQRRV